MQVYPLQSQPGTNNPFSYNLATSVNQNGSNLTPMSSSFHNLWSHFNDVNQCEVDWQSLCSAGFETGASSAYQFPPNLPDNKGDLDPQQNVPVLPPPEGNFNDQCGLLNINVGGGNVENSNRYLHDIYMKPDSLFTDEQDNCQPPSQQQDGGHDQLPYQVEVQDPAANQVQVEETSNVYGYASIC
ncbi:hypothetical protein PRUPE_6G254800 [Prunus persica]|uniref:Uncharacterized protein n=1 Tax=Prunus persica TaxID=3760 RepID=A0A251NVS8_PRUPE|nr:uncharacterized protein LOC109949936 isoform X2 [Prunus persica]ONI03401.1 hypothetical protein PRUPE_6G254800 [Prunus persica]